MRITIIGAGVIGMNCAYYLNKKGYEVTVIDSNDLSDGCSFGNLGYISPSHFIPLASPGMVWQGMKWMLNASSPFYIKPRLDWQLIQWGIEFYKSANASTLLRNTPHLNSLLQLSRRLITEIRIDIGCTFDLQDKGCWMLYKSKKTAEHERSMAEQANKFGLLTRICTRREVQDHEPETEVNVMGGVLYLDDAYVEPREMMKALHNCLLKRGVHFKLNQSVTGFEKRNNKVTAIITGEGKLAIDELVIANGSRMPSLAKMLAHKLLLEPGKGYSFKYQDLQNNLHYPAILVDDRVAVSPYNRMLRIGGTMELSGHNDKPLPKRIAAICHAFRKYYPGLQIDTPSTDDTWFGYRPVTPDGMPYIGRQTSLSNVCYAGGHAMLGMATAAGTGQMVLDIIENKDPAISQTAFSPARFG